MFFSRYGTSEAALPSDSEDGSSKHSMVGRTDYSFFRSTFKPNLHIRASEIFQNFHMPVRAPAEIKRQGRSCLSDMPVMFGAACQLSMLRLRLKCSHGNHSTPPLTGPQNRSVFVVAMRSTQIPNPCWNLRMAELRVVDVQTNTRKELPR